MAWGWVRFHPQSYFVYILLLDALSQFNKSFFSEFCYKAISKVWVQFAACLHVSKDAILMMRNVAVDHFLYSDSLRIIKIDQIIGQWRGASNFPGVI